MRWEDRTQRILTAVKLLCCAQLQWWLHSIIYLSKPIKCMPPRMNPNINDGFGVINQCRFSDCNKHTPLMGDVHKGEEVPVGSTNYT